MFFGPPESGSGSSFQKYGSGSFYYYEKNSTLRFFYVVNYFFVTFYV